jgi:hypothetical protein
LTGRAAPATDRRTEENTVIARLLSALAAILLVSAVVAGAPAANADTLTACEGQLTQLQGDVLTVPITGGKADKERAGLVKLVEDATALVDVGKTGDAVVKLTNLQTKVDDLAAAGRISGESAALLTGDISSATECLSAG